MSKPYLGVIEGFFGEAWSWPDRLSYAPFLQARGYHFYVYAPKSDPYLRKRWQEPLPDDHADALMRFSETYHAHGLECGVGLSPFEAYRDYGAERKRELREKVTALNAMSLDILCVLFDDMRGDLPHLAETQVRILKDIREISTAKRIIFCPTYYSTDPIIERVFGAMPAQYLETLGRELDATTDIFWTGPKVCSTEYPRIHLEEIAERLQRQPFLWDNYPVNDSRKMSPFLYVRAFENRNAELASLVRGHAVNPMKQSWLSRIPLATLPMSYKEGESYDARLAEQRAATLVCGDDVGRAIIDDLSLFHDSGLACLTEQQRDYLRIRYSHFGGDPFAQEILAWLDGRYEFDPACLTD